jgi:hypothetical protein
MHRFGPGEKCEEVENRNTINIRKYFSRVKLFWNPWIILWKLSPLSMLFYSIYIGFVKGLSESNI